ncbi:MAG: T9SS type A sorting domain-containing protein [bacterium]|nr:T9SS type A sorting domain-containing protein [bacterium]
MKIRRNFGYRRVKIAAAAAIIVLTGVGTALALNASSIVAYPVPFNPNKIKYITIGDPAAAADTNVRVDVNVYDINGDKVFGQTYSALPVQWNGRNSSGSLIKPGMYIIKVKVEDEGASFGEFKEKLIRILVSY